VTTKFRSMITHPILFHTHVSLINICKLNVVNKKNVYFPAVHRTRRKGKARNACRVEPVEETAQKEAR
jgi:hypothetical protein